MYGVTGAFDYHREFLGGMDKSVFWVWARLLDH